MKRTFHDVEVAIAVLILAVSLLFVFVSETKKLARDVVREMVKNEALRPER